MCVIGLEFGGIVGQDVVLFDAAQLSETFAAHVAGWD